MATFSDISPVRQGQTDPPSTWVFKDFKGNSKPLPVGTVFTLYLYDPNTNVSIAGQGAFDATNIALGTVVYSWNANDTATPGKYQVYVGYVTPGGAQGYTYPPEDFEILPLFTQQ